MIRSKGHCNTMGTASTMAVMAEALGTTIPGVAGTPAPDSRLLEHAHAAGRLAVEMVAGGTAAQRRHHDRVVPQRDRRVGGHRRIHQRCRAPVGDRRPAWGSTCSWRTSIGSVRSVPLLVNVQPAGTYLMDDMYRAGGLLAVLREVKDLLDPTALTVTGQPLTDYLGDTQIWDEDVILPSERAADGQCRHRRAPRHPCAQRRVIKPAAASKDLLVHRGRAVVFDSIEDFHARIDDPDLDIDETCVMVLRGCGPKGYPGMPEAANTPLPAKLLASRCTGHDPDL